LNHITDRDASRLSRLRWLDSARWLDANNSRWYTPLHVGGGGPGASAHGSDGVTATTSAGGGAPASSSDAAPTIEFLNRRVRLGGLGLPSAIASNGHAVLDSPISFTVVSAAGRAVAIAPPAARLELEVRSTIQPLAELYEGCMVVLKVSWCGITSVKRLGPGAASWSSEWSAAADLRGAAAQELRGLSARCAAELSSDGYLELSLTLRASRPIELRDVRLQVPLARAVAKWIMGLDVSPSGRFDAANLPAGQVLVYESTFSRTVWRLYDGAKGLVMWYSPRSPTRSRRTVSTSTS
jgi:hypothetical protein